MMEQIKPDSLFSWMQEHGTATVIAAFVIILAVTLTNIALKAWKCKKDIELETWKTEKELELEQKKIDLYNKNKKDEEQWEILKNFLMKANSGHSPAEEQENSEINQAIENTLEDLKQKIDCDHAALFQYHNGGKDLIGRPFQNMTCSIEVSKKYLKLFGPDMKRIPRSYLSGILKHIKTTDCFFSRISKDDTIDEATQSRLLAFNTDSLFVCPIRNQDGINTGFVLITYNTSVENPSEFEPIIKTAVSKIEGLQMSSSFAKR